MKLSLVILIYLLFYTLPKLALHILQIRHIQGRLRLSVPAIFTKERYLASASYALDKQRFDIVALLYEALLFAMWLSFGFGYLAHSLASVHNSLLQALYFFTLFMLITTVLQLPFSIYETFVINNKHGFSTTTPLTFIKDLFKGYILLVVACIIIATPILYFITNYANWWLYSYIAVMIVITLLNLLYPSYIAPIFNKFTLLKDEILEAKINELMTRSDFRSKGVYVVDASRRDRRLNAYFSGLGRSKRVVLYDTLLDRISQRGLLAILGHELGHFKHHDIYKNLCVVGVILFFVFAISGMLLPLIFSYLGFSLGAYLRSGFLLALLMLVLPCLTFYFLPIIGYFSRRAEYRADEYAASLTSADDLLQALIRLVNENKSFPTAHWLYIAIYHTHPPLLERLEALGYEESSEASSPVHGVADARLDEGLDEGAMARRASMASPLG